MEYLVMLGKLLAYIALGTMAVLFLLHRANKQSAWPRVERRATPRDPAQKAAAPVNEEREALVGLAYLGGSALLVIVVIAVSLFILVGCGGSGNAAGGNQQGSTVVNQPQEQSK